MTIWRMKFHHGGSTVGPTVLIAAIVALGRALKPDFAVTMGIAPVAGVIALGVFGGIIAMPGATGNRDTGAISVGPGLLYIAETGSTEPTAIDPSTWDVAWTELGYTDAGSEFKVAPTSNDVNVAEETDPVLTIVSTTKTTLTATLAQITAFNLAVAFGGRHVTPGSPGSRSPSSRRRPASRTSTCSAGRRWTTPRRMIWRKCQPDGSLDLTRAAGATKAGIPVNISILAIGGGTAPWKWMGVKPARVGPDPAHRLGE